MAVPARVRPGNARCRVLPEVIRLLPMPLSVRLVHRAVIRMLQRLPRLAWQARAPPVVPIIRIILRRVKPPRLRVKYHVLREVMYPLLLPRLALLVLPPAGSALQELSIKGHLYHARPAL